MMLSRKYFHILWSSRSKSYYKASYLDFTRKFFHVVTSHNRALIVDRCAGVKVYTCKVAEVVVFDVCNFDKVS